MYDFTSIPLIVLQLLTGTCGRLLFRFRELNVFAKLHSFFNDKSNILTINQLRYSRFMITKVILLLFMSDAEERKRRSFRNYKLKTLRFREKRYTNLHLNILSANKSGINMLLEIICYLIIYKYIYSAADGTHYTKVVSFEQAKVDNYRIINFFFILKYIVSRRVFHVFVDILRL